MDYRLNCGEMRVSETWQSVGTNGITIKTNILFLKVSFTPDISESPGTTCRTHLIYFWGTIFEDQSIDRTPPGNDVHSDKLTKLVGKNGLWMKYFLLKIGILHCYVSLPEGKNCAFVAISSHVRLHWPALLIEVQLWSQKKSFQDCSKVGPPTIVINGVISPL